MTLERSLYRHRQENIVYFSLTVTVQDIFQRDTQISQMVAGRSTLTSVQHDVRILVLNCSRMRTAEH